MNPYMGYLMCQYSSLKLGIDTDSTHGNNDLHVSNYGSNTGNSIKCLGCACCVRCVM